MVNVLFSPHGVELGLGGKFRGYADRIERDTTDDFHTNIDVLVDHVRRTSRAPLGELR